MRCEMVKSTLNQNKPLKPFFKQQIVNGRPRYEEENQ